MYVPQGFEPHWLDGVGNDEYHADLTSVSSTGLREVLDSPRSFKLQFIDGNRKPETEAMKLGTLVHRVVLEGADFLKCYAVMPTKKWIDLYGSANAKTYKAARAEWQLEHAGVEVVTEKDFDSLRCMLDSIVENDDAMNLLRGGVVERSGYYRCDETGIKCRLRPDFFSADSSVVVDLKTTTDARWHAFRRTIWDWRYDVQIAMYGHGAGAIERKPVDFHAWIVIEKSAPAYESAVYVADADMLKRGRDDYHRALRTVHDCLRANHWPRRQRCIQDISLPLYALENADGL